MKVLERIIKATKKRPMHFSLMDPDIKKNSLAEAGERASMLSEMGTDAIMVGGSTGVNTKFLDDFVLAIKSGFRGPVILFPGGLSGITRHADALLYMSLLNSRNSFWITGVQAQAAPYIKQAGIEAIPVAYVIIEPGMRVAEVGEAEIIRRNEDSRAARYASAAEMLGFSLVYLEAGSGAGRPVPPKMIAAVRREIKIPLIAGGGIRTPSDARNALRAGADIIVTGTAIENDIEKAGSIIQAVKGFRKPR